MDYVFWLWLLGGGMNSIKGYLFDAICYCHPRMLQKLHLFMLWFIGRKEIHGYEITNTLRKNGLDFFGPSRIYPLLSDMLKAGLISQKEKKQGKRVRKVYVLTKKGKTALSNGKSLFKMKSVVREFLKEMLS